MNVIFKMTLTDFVLNISLDDMKLRYAILITSSLFAGSGYDNGYAAGKGNLDLSLTWNPFDYFDHGQSYIVLGYGITDKIDIHAYYASPILNNNNYYLGLFYQFFSTEQIYLATAVGLRRYTNENTQHLFAPQFLYTFKLKKGYEIGGSFVNINKINNFILATSFRKSADTSALSDLGTAIDVAFYIPIIHRRNDKFIQEVKLGIGAFRPILWEPNWGDWYPTYSLDVKIGPLNG